MLLRRHHAVQKPRAVMRKTLQKFPHQQLAQLVMTVIQIHVAVIAAVAVEDEDVVVHKVKAQMEPNQIQVKIQQKNQKIVQRPNLEMAPRIAVAVAVVPQEKMSLQERQSMKMVLLQL
jgi:hypothetical protein